MKKEQIEKYLNNTFMEQKKNNDLYPKSLFKYRPFDQFSLDMLENDYIYLCRAGNEDDKTECYTYIDEKLLDEFMSSDFRNDVIVNFVCSCLKGICPEANIEAGRDIYLRAIEKDGSIKNSNLMDCAAECSNILPNEVNTTIVNTTKQINTVLQNEKFKKQYSNLLLTGFNSKKQIGICSFSELKDNKEMRKKYADNYKGYCIEYSFENYININSLFPVIYTNKRDPNLVKAIIETILGTLIEKLSDGKINTNKSQYLKLFLTKNTKREYQREWRIIDFDGVERTKSPKIKCIYLGKYMNDKNKNEIIKFCDNHRIKYLIDNN